MRKHAGSLVPASILLGFFVAVFSAPLPAQTPPRRPLALDDLSKLKSVGDPQVSPDGRWVAYTVTTVDVEKDKRDTQVWMASWDGAEQVKLTGGAENATSPRWSPDGRYLAFLASRGDEEEKKKGAQVWLLNRAGGEGQKLTDIKPGVSEYAWSPDGKRLVLLVNDVDPNAEPEKKEGWKRKTKPPVVVDRYHFKQDREGYLERLYSHLTLFDVEGRTAETLTSGGFEESSPAWSPDGQSIAFFSGRAADPDRTEETDLWVIDAKKGAAPRKLDTLAGSKLGRPAWSPDGRTIAYLQGDENRYSAYTLAKLATTPTAGGTPRVLTAAIDRAVSGNLLWSADGGSLLGIVSDDRTSYVARVPAAGGPVEKLTIERRTVSSLNGRPDGALALLTATATEPPEVHALEKGVLRRISRQNDDLLKQLQLATTEDFTSKSPDGTEVHGLMVKPAGFVAGRRYPTILSIHGGPNGQDEHSFSFDREFFAANGYVVLAINYRGSSGRGLAYQRAIFADWGNKEVVDLLGAVDHAVASGVADPNRLGIGGWSYGGILTDYAIATAPDRFKAAVSGAGSALQLTMYGTDQYIVQYEAELGPPWRNLEPWLKVSYPFLHADRIKTPTLFLCGQNDFNVPIAGSEQMYQALKSVGVESQLVIYPGQFHGLTIPSYQRDRLSRYLAWYDKYVKGEKIPH